MNAGVFSCYVVLSVSEMHCVVSANSSGGPEGLAAEVSVMFWLADRFEIRGVEFDG